MPPAQHESRCFPPTPRPSWRPLRSWRSSIRRRTRHSTCSRSSPTPRGACCCSATSSRTRIPGPSCRWMPSARATSASRARRPGRVGPARHRLVRRQRRHGGSRRERAGRGDRLSAAAGAELAPIAVDDTVVVRAGAQIDIPVLENDISPAGGRPTLNPASVVSSTKDALAFASGDVLRYLAPRARGVHDRLLGVHDGRSVARRHRDRPRPRARRRREPRPRPETLEGRVLSGQSTSSSSTASAWTRTAMS